MAGDPLGAVGRADRPRHGRGAARRGPRSRRSPSGCPGRGRARRPAVGPGGERGRAADRAARKAGALEEIYAEQVAASSARSSVADESGAADRRGAARAAPARSREAQGLRPPRPDAVQRLVARLAGLGEEHRDLDAGAARDRGAPRARAGARRAASPSRSRDFDQLVANMQLAYADAVCRPDRLSVGIFGGSGFYSLLEDAETSRSRRRTGSRRRRSRSARSAGSASRSCRGTAAARAAAAPDPVPGERVGDAGARRPAHHRAVCLGRAPARPRARRVRRLRPVRRPNVGQGGHVLRRAGDDARLGRRSATAPTCAASRRDRGRARCSRPGRWHGRRRPGAAVLDPRRVALVPGARRRRRQHDRVPGVHLARELELCYATIAMVTDYDVGVEGDEPVTADRVLEVFRREQRAPAGAAARGRPRGSALSRTTSARPRSGAPESR